jgi:hypothetical protein
MTLISCPECTRLVPDFATACPECGHPVGETRASEANSSGKPRTGSDPSDGHADPTSLVSFPGVVNVNSDQKPTPFRPGSWRSTSDASAEGATESKVDASGSEPDLSHAPGCFAFIILLSSGIVLCGALIDEFNMWLAIAIAVGLLLATIYAFVQLLIGNVNAPGESKHTAPQASPPTTPKVLCPTCGSGNVEKRSMGKKAGAAATFGLLSLGYLSKTFRCRACGYSW